MDRYDPKAKYKKKTWSIYVYLLVRKLSQPKMLLGLLLVLGLLWVVTMEDDMDPV
jgi:hypothetical protein